MAAKALVVAATVLTWGCATIGSTDTVSEAATPQRGVELIVRNERQATVSVSVQWEDARPTLLDELGGGASATFNVPMRGSALRVIFGSIGSGPGSREDPPYVDVRAGDRLEWTLRGDRSVFYQRLSP
jgi:hypothetical protein